MISNSSTARSESTLCPTGVEGLDEILAGGLPSQRLYLVQGDPGSGKTTLALQFLLEGVKRNERVLYISLSETKNELTGVARSHGWSLEGVPILELSSLKQLLDSLSEVRLPTHYGTERRQICPVKFRGHKFREGHHDYTIATGGLQVYPRISAPPQSVDFKADEVPSGIREAVEKEGLKVGVPLKDFQGVLKGVPTFFGAVHDTMVAHGTR